MKQPSEYLPFWSKLNHSQQAALSASVRERRFLRGTLLHDGSADCIGLLLVKTGCLRAYMESEEGREITLYRLLDGEMCLFSASCMMRSIRFDVLVAAEEDTTVFHIPPDPYRRLMEESAAVANYTNDLMAARFSDVMWLLDQVLNKKLDSRLSAFLLEEAARQGQESLWITHEQIAGHLGSVREVITRMLRHFQNDGLVKLNRGSIQILDREGLASLAGASLR